MSGGKEFGMDYFKKDIYKYVQQQTGLSMREAKTATNAVLDSIMQCMQQGRRLRITRFGTFFVKHHKSRQSVSINGGTTTIPDRYIVRFKPGSNMKKSVSKLKL